MGDETAGRYARAQLTLAIIGLILGTLYLGLLLATGAARAIADSAGEITTAWPLQIHPIGMVRDT